MAKQSVSIGFSPCPNDTFIFDALVHGRIDTGGLVFEPVLEDVETLNRMAMAGKLDVTKLSYHTYCYNTKQYQLLQTGSALGRGCGPLLVAKRPLSGSEIETGPIAIPGNYTTANLLFSLAYPRAKNKTAMVFSAIEESVLNGKAVAGVIIHENRFTYADKGLHKIIDLGEYWEQQTQSPIPLGGIVVRREWPEDLKQQVNRLVGESVAYAFAHPEVSKPYVCAHAQEMNESVMQQHIDLYVNEYSLALGLSGQHAVRILFEKARETGLISEWKEPLWV
jgi:1,4-dihydroxy-6-naphthoate synthase